jgi:hypothetical protein
VKASESLRQDIAAQAILLSVDAEKGEGIGLARRYGVYAYPTFVLVDAEGNLLDGWLGFEAPTPFLTALREAAAAPQTLYERRRQYRQAPSANAAVKIAELEEVGGHFGESLAWYRRAQELGSETNLAPAMFEVVARGHRDGLFGEAALLEPARQVIADPRSSGRQVMETVGLLGQATQGKADRSAYLEVLERGALRLEGATSAEDQRFHAALMADHTLLNEGRHDEAFAWKQKSMEPGWQTRVADLNAIAWWCFESGVALEQGEDYARHGVELATEPAEKANVLDTLAELCNARGGAAEALSLSREALGLSPDSDYLKQQVGRFEQLVASGASD